MKSVYSAVQTGSLNKAVCHSSLKVLWCRCAVFTMCTASLILRLHFAVN